MSEIRLDGIFPALLTPFGEDGELDLPSFRAHVSYLLNAGMAGVTVAGSTGEAILLTRQERRTLIGEAADLCRGKGAVIAGTGAASEWETLELTRDAAEMGADAALVLTPFVVCPDQDALYDHYRRLSESGGIPIILYDFPPATNVELSVDTILRLAEIDNIVGIKVSSGDLGKIGELVQRLDGMMSVICGSDDLLMPSFALGCPAGILAIGNIAPVEVNQILQAVRDGDLAAARDLHYRLLPVGRAVAGSDFVSVVKEMSRLLGRIDSARVRPPLRELSDEGKLGAELSLRKSGLL